VLERHIVLLGVSGVGLLDRKTTPLGPVLGTEIHAQLIESIALRTLLVRPSYASRIELALVLASGLLVIGVLRYQRPLIASAGMLAIALLLVGTEAGLFRFAGWLLDTLYSTGTALIPFGTMLGGNYIAAQRERRRLAVELERGRKEAAFIQEAFGHYLAPDLVNLLMANPKRLQLGGETRELTLLFCDVRGFTSISESYKTNPQGLTRLINRFLTPMTDLIICHQGMIDKYMGDCIMAFWNAPVDVPNHANHACDSALAMVNQLASLNEELAAEAEAEGRPFHRIDVGIGLNSGECVVGNMGSDQRFDYSAMGDAVNLASRLEGQSKTYHVNIVIGEATREAAPSWAAVELDLLEVQGKREAVKIYALLGDAALAVTVEFQSLVECHDMMLACYRKQDWSGARAALGASRGRDARLDGLYNLYTDRIAHFEAYPPPPDWSGVYVALTK
jgi:adenylate cyclase